MTFNRDFFSNGVYFFVYQESKIFLEKCLENESDLFEGIKYGVSGAVAGGLCWLISHPFDTVKTIIQMNNLSEKRLKQNLVFRKFFKNGLYLGFMDLYRGGLPSFCSLVVSSCLFFIIYEKSKKYFKI